MPNLTFEPQSLQSSSDRHNLKLSQPGLVDLVFLSKSISRLWHGLQQMAIWICIGHNMVVLTWSWWITIFTNNWGTCKYLWYLQDVLEALPAVCSSRSSCGTDRTRCTGNGLKDHCQSQSSYIGTCPIPAPEGSRYCSTVDALATLAELMLYIKMKGLQKKLWSGEFLPLALAILVGLTWLGFPA